MPSKKSRRGRFMRRNRYFSEFTRNKPRLLTLKTGLGLASLAGTLLQNKTSNQRFYSDGRDLNIAKRTVDFYKGTAEGFGGVISYDDLLAQEKRYVENDRIQLPVTPAKFDEAKLTIAKLSPLFSSMGLFDVRKHMMNPTALEPLAFRNLKTIRSCVTADTRIRDNILKGISETNPYLPRLKNLSSLSPAQCEIERSSCPRKTRRKRHRRALADTQGFRTNVSRIPASNANLFPLGPIVDTLEADKICEELDKSCRLLGLKQSNRDRLKTIIKFSKIKLLPATSSFPRRPWREALPPGDAIIDEEASIDAGDNLSSSEGTSDNSPVGACLKDMEDDIWDTIPQE